MYLATVVSPISMPSFRKLAMNPRCAPTWIGQAHAPDKRTDFGGCCWASLFGSTLPGPVQLEALAMPCDDGLRLDDPSELRQSRQR
jgi:hypothetical protein